jgi:hypothetical protein
LLLEAVKASLLVVLLAVQIAAEVIAAIRASPHIAFIPKLFSFLSGPFVSRRAPAVLPVLASESQWLGNTLPVAWHAFPFHFIICEPSWAGHYVPPAEACKQFWLHQHEATYLFSAIYSREYNDAMASSRMGIVRRCVHLSPRDLSAYVSS